MIIRPFRPEDRGELMRMRRALWPDSTEDELDQLLAEPLSETLVLVADRWGAGLGGFAEITLRKFAEGCSSSPVAYLEGIWIDPDMRRMMIASELVKHGEAWAWKLGLTEFASDCEAHNEESRAFHLAAGFSEVQGSINFKRNIAPESP